MPQSIVADEHSDQKGTDFSESDRSYAYEEQLWYGPDEYEADFEDIPVIVDTKKHIAVGDILPYGIRMYTGINNIFRLRDIGVKSRIMIVGVIGSFTPLCWNYHFLEVLHKFRYFEERGIDYICCISTNDSFAQGAWAIFLGCNENIIMVGDSSKAFTKAIGMDIVVPWLDENIRSRRYVIYAEDMVVSKMVVAPRDDMHMDWHCEHIPIESESTEESDSGSESLTASW